MNIDATILIGGNARRMQGLNKSFLKVDGKRIIDRNLEILYKLFPEISIISNRKDEFVEYEKCLLYSDIIPNKGPLGGIYTALKNSKSESTFFMAGDMLLLHNDIVSEIIKKFQNSNYEIVIAKSENGIEPLFGIYSKTLIKSIEKNIYRSDNLSVKRYVMSQNYAVVNTYNNILNINNNEDLTKANELFNSVSEHI
ncbi:MAG: molybdenum cofactor guanylyltransferase [Candidatus Cloacimonadota bacterium]|nr:molybdenum cofactor guanylyltransferase [Candidatus Cloacimonadota bacterium]